MIETVFDENPRPERAAAALRRGLLALLLLFVLLVGLRVHGFSLPVWHALIDQSETHEVLLGEPRYMRADDWLVQLPLAYAQAAHDPPFPLHNTNVGDGQNMLLPIVVPVARPATLLRPTQWGFFLGNDVGTAWLWWSQVLGLYAVAWGVLSIVTRGRVALAAAGAALLCVSPFFQFWSFTKSTIVIHAGLAFIAAVGVLTARSRIGILASGAGLGLAGAAFAVVLYPPFQVPVAYAMAVLLGTWMLDRRAQAPWRDARGLRLGALGLAAGVVTVGLAAFLVDARDAIELIRGTVYPGNRVSSGGDAPIWRLFTAHVATSMQVTRFGPLENIVEAASFWLAFPVVGSALLLERSRDPVALGLLGYCVAVLLYQVVGIPEALARITLMAFVPADRALLGLGVADVLLTVRFLACRRGTQRIAVTEAAAVAILWLMAIEAAGWGLMRRLPELTVPVTVTCALVGAAFAYGLTVRWQPTRLVTALAVALGTTTLWWNPLVVGGSDYLAENPLSKRIVEIDAEHGGQSVWLVYGNSDLPNLMRVLGVRAIGGNLPLPALGLWSRLDPEGQAMDVYNRYAHVGFLRPADGQTGPVFQKTSHHAFAVRLDPEGPGMQALGVTHLLVSGRKATREWWSRYAPDERIGRHLLFSLPLRAADAP